MMNRVFKSGSTERFKKVLTPEVFQREEDGSFTIFVLLGVLVIFATTGIGVDVMNFERDRATLQSTLDRAVLAAADLDQTLPPRQVVESYLDKAGLSDKLKSVNVQEGFGSRTVSATAETVVNTNFMRFSGHKTLTAQAASTAEESIGSVEISLVLDMSGSMNRASAEAGRTKIEVLRSAAKEFVTLMLDKPGESQISMSIIPYATQVSAGDDILKHFSNVSSEHDFSHCINFTSAQFGSSALDPTISYDRTAPFDPFQYTNNAEQFPRFPVCPVRAGSDITAVTDDIDVLHNRIDALTANGNTSIDVGMKWGVGMLDPKFQNVVGELARENIVPDKFKDRPEAYDSEVLKVAIVMTDGQNTTQYMLKDQYRSGFSDIWFNPEFVRRDGSTGEYSIRFRRNPDRYVWMQQSIENGAQFGGGFITADYPYGNPPNENSFNNEPGTATRMTFPQLFNQASLYWNATNNYFWQSNHVFNWFQNPRISVGPTTKNSRTTSICGAAKNNGVIIYGIAFEAPNAGLTTIKNCASSDSHVYEVDEFDDPEGISLQDAFASIASSIKKLRLTQ
jgi:Flp pilus assembly protein TadG